MKSKLKRRTSIEAWEKSSSLRQEVTLNIAGVQQAKVLKTWKTLSGLIHCSKKCIQSKQFHQSQLEAKTILQQAEAELQ